MAADLKICRTVAGGKIAELDAPGLPRAFRLAPLVARMLVRHMENKFAERAAYRRFGYRFGLACFEKSGCDTGHIFQ